MGYLVLCKVGIHVKLPRTGRKAMLGLKAAGARRFVMQQVKNPEAQRKVTRSFSTCLYIHAGFFFFFLPTVRAKCFKCLQEVKRRGLSGVKRKCEGS